MDFRDSFKKFGGEKIPDVITYISDYILDHPNATISVGCDSSVKRNSVLYAVTIMLYDHSITKGAHIIFYRTSIKGKLDNSSRLYKEAEMVHAVGEYLEENLKHKRNDITDDLTRRYKLHLEQHNGNRLGIEGYDEQIALNTINITDKDRAIEYKVCDVHLDYNLSYADGHNKSHPLFKATVPWLKSLGYRVWCKPYSHASTSAADLLVK